ncbi:MAG: hypothetical protein WC523_06870 [Patescibacteria group bacterium]|jgi:hypothetical protein
MNKLNDIEKRLGHLDFPEIKLVGHQARLKNDLLAAKRFHSNNNLNFLFIIKQIKFAVPALILTVAVICGAFCLGLIPGFNKVGTAQAKELIAESQFAIEKLSREARAQLEELIKADLSKSLEEAYNAKDLEFVGEEDLSPRSQDNGDNLQNDLAKTIAAATATSSSENQNESGNKKMVLDNYLIDYNERMTVKIKVLKYTDKDGHKIIIGLNPENLPVMQIKVSENEKK